MLHNDNWKWLEEFGDYPHILTPNKEKITGLNDLQSIIIYLYILFPTTLQLFLYFR